MEVFTFCQMHVNLYVRQCALQVGLVGVQNLSAVLVISGIRNWWRIAVQCRGKCRSKQTFASKQEWDERWQVGSMSKAIIYQTRAIVTTCSASIIIRIPRAFACSAIWIMRSNMFLHSCSSSFVRLTISGSNLPVRIFRTLNIEVTSQFMSRIRPQS